MINKLRTASEHFFIEILKKYPDMAVDIVKIMRQAQLIEYSHIRNAMYFRGEVLNNHVTPEKYILDTFGEGGIDITQKRELQNVG